MDGDFLAVSSHHLAQEGRTASFNACNNPDYMKWFGYDLHDIVAVFSLWDMVSHRAHTTNITMFYTVNFFLTMRYPMQGCDESWLDGCTGCGGCCDLSSASVTFSNFQLSPARESDIPQMKELWRKYNPGQ